MSGHCVVHKISSWVHIGFKPWLARSWISSNSLYVLQVTCKYKVFMTLILKRIVQYRARNKSTHTRRYQCIQLIAELDVGSCYKHVGGGGGSHAVPRVRRGWARPGPFQDTHELHSIMAYPPGAASTSKPARETWKHVTCNITHKNS
jgi:hypothetical protein